ncbi:C40 family peptidase [Actinacidiphila yeochonensis]|uniref:C40 family peptidase n=1 Tax=Actinacidiphila yeochonensis TaxID=89050 RepID=UPI00099D1C5F|nr:C40 family peptidase [Actinacidiphila yeochonensis]
MTAAWPRTDAAPPLRRREPPHLPFPRGAGLPPGAAPGPARHAAAGRPSRAAAGARAALCLALASAASWGLLGETAHAAPQPAPESAGAKVADLYQQAEEATQRYDGAHQKADDDAAEVTALQGELARKTAAMNSTRDQLGVVAAAQYRTGTLDPALQFALSASPEDYLEQSGYLDRLGSRQSAVLSRLAGQRRDIEQTRAEAAGRLARLRAAQSTLADRKKDAAVKLHAAQALLASLPPGQRTAIIASEGDTPDGSSLQTAGAAARHGATLRVPLGSAPAPSARAARAVAFAYRAIGLPYVWGATGPNAYDCSGLTQAAWRAAGVSLPRTTYQQINAGTRVSESQLRPGDLVFFYSGVSHVGLYIGDGEMIHAPHPGAAVRIAPISEMPIAGATRPV